MNIIGEHVDYQDGLCLPMAISHRCFAAAARTPTDRLRVRSAQSEVVLDIDAR
ncbi:galactokinase family protein [Lactiplantibacillus plantarum]|nr:galactokinase family protein [Lactiplantibacillus plantarum]